MKDSNWRKCLICDDSRNVIKQIPDKSIDLILTDPPYNIGKHSTGNIPFLGRAPMNNDVADWDWVDFFPEEWANEFIRVLKPNGNLFIFTSYNQLGRWYNCLDHKFDTSNFMIWHKTNPAPKIFKAGFLNSCEMIFTCWNKKHTWNFISQKEMHNFLESPICMRPERLNNPKHPAQKPVSILKKIIEIASNEDDIIFDPFMGVGSIGVAAMNKKRKFIGIEINPIYFDAAKKRIVNEMNKQEYPITENSKEIVCKTTVINHQQTIWDLDKPAKKSQPRLQPLLKWAGGKEKELKYIIPNLPKKFNNYYEPFVGGGSVFTAVNANHFFINDYSSELISLYRYIAEQNETFFKYVESINHSWDNAHAFFEKHILFLTSIYSDYQKDTITKDELKHAIIEFCHSQANDISSIIDNTIKQHCEVLTLEIQNNLFRKMSRMKVLEQEKHLLPLKDLYNNIETSIKSALYMYFRHLYNTKQIETGNNELYCALFLFIRNYCYSGMFRYNDHGEFNVPYGGIGYNTKNMGKKLQYYRSDSLLERFNNTTISNYDFEQFLRMSNPQENDFIFLDPPYDSEFSTYAQNEFTRKDQQRLADYMLKECRSKWMLVIKNTDFIYSLYNHEGINIRFFDKKYLVSFMNRNDKKVTHLLITNY